MSSLPTPTIVTETVLSQHLRSHCLSQPPSAVRFLQQSAYTRKTHHTSSPRATPPSYLNVQGRQGPSDPDKTPRD